MNTTLRHAALAFAAALSVAAAPAAGALTVPAPGEASADGAVATLADAMEADKAFAAATAKDGPAAAFAAWFEPEDSQFIAPGQVSKGATAIAAGFAGSPPGFAIAWVPDGGVGSAGGDLAVTTGRYTVKQGEQVLEAGRYITTWRRNTEGVWKVAIDTTIADPAAAPAPK